MAKRGKYTKGLNAEAHEFVQAFNKGKRIEDGSLPIEKLTFEDFQALEGERHDGTSFKEVVAATLTGSKTAAQLASTATRYFSGAKVHKRIETWEQKDQDAWNEITNTKITKLNGEVEEATIGDVLQNVELDHLLEKGELRRQYVLDVWVKENLLDLIERWLVQWKEGGKKRKAQQAIESLTSQVAQQNKGIAEIKIQIPDDSDVIRCAIISTLEEKIESLKKQKEKEMKKYEDTYDEPYVSPSLLKRSNSAVEANAKFKENCLQNAEIKKQQNERLATITETQQQDDEAVVMRIGIIKSTAETYLKAARMRGEAPFPEGSGGNDVEDLSQSQASVESQIREIELKEKEQQEQKAALLAKRRKPSTPGTVQKVKKPRITAPDPKHVVAVDAENAAEVSDNN
jgi:hypothetical protein